MPRLKQTILITFYCLLFYKVNGQTEKINGLSFVSSRDAINSSHIQPVKKASANYVSLMPFGFIKDLKSPKISFNTKRQWYGETEEGLKQYANQFKKAHIKLMVKPQIWVWGGAYTGQIQMNSEEEWEILEDSYEEFIISYAKIAAELNASVFCIGTELEKFVISRPLYWEQLIKKIKLLYKGKITYAANWDEFKRVPFWNALDFIGIDAYFPLSNKKTPTTQDFEEGWQPHKKQIKKIQAIYKKPVLFTEYGYRSIDYTGKEPWNSNKVIGNVNLTAQVNATQAIYNEFWNEDWFAGGFLWKWFHNHNNSGGENNNRFTPQNKPTEKLIQKLYGN